MIRITAPGEEPGVLRGSGHGVPRREMDIVLLRVDDSEGTLHRLKDQRGSEPVG
jgi:hypothetical protein